MTAFVVMTRDGRRIDATAVEREAFWLRIEVPCRQLVVDEDQRLGSYVDAGHEVRWLPAGTIREVVELEQEAPS